MTLDLNANLKVMKILHQKLKKILEQTDIYLTENNLTLNPIEQRGCFFFTNHTNLDSEFSFKGEVNKPA